MRRPMKATRLLPGVLLGGAMVALLSCTEPAPLGVARHELAPPLPPGGSLEPSLLPWCAPLPYDSVTATIGPAGGVLPVGAHVLVFLPNSDRKSTRLNSSHGYISYAVFCLKKKNDTQLHV